MKRLMVVMAFMFTFLGCTSSTPTSSGTMSPIQAAGCDVETAILGGASTAVGTALSCTNTSAIQASLTTALGNANLCAAPGVAAVTGSAIKAKAVGKLVIGNIACPIAINTIVGFLSNTVPTAWGCSATASASSLAATLTTVCEAAVPI